MDVDGQGGTVDTTGSQASGVDGGTGIGDDGAGTAQEPMVTVGDKQVPLSVAQRALKNDEHFTQTSQAQAEREKALAQREREAQEQLLATTSLSGVATAMADPDTLERVLQVAPHLKDLLPTQNEQVDGKLLAQNLGLRFDLFTRDNPEYSDEQQQGIRSEAFRLASAGRFDDALDFDNIGLRLYKDDIIAREAQKLSKAQEDEERKRRQAGSLGQGAAQIPTGQDISHLRGEALLSAAHRENDAKRAKRR